MRVDTVLQLVSAGVVLSTCFVQQAVSLGADLPVEVAACSSLAYEYWVELSACRPALLPCAAHVSFLAAALP
jgi:hypothetical protein